MTKSLPKKKKATVDPKIKKDRTALLKYKKYFNGKTIRLKEFEKKIEDYYHVHKKFWEWRKNFKYPGVDYLKRLKSLKPCPSNELVKDLARCISELHSIFRRKSDYRAMIIYKLFLYYIAQCFKVKLSIKWVKFSWLSDTPVDNDLNSIISFINTEILDNDRSKSDLAFNYYTPLGRIHDAKDYGKTFKSLNYLLSRKDKKKKIKYLGYKSVPINYVIVANFFRLDFFNDNEKIEKIIFNKEIVVNANLEDRLIISKNKNFIEIYWGNKKDNKPNGKGISETYETNEVVKKLFENPAIGEHWWKRYSRNLKAKDLSGYILFEIYQGQWKNGLREGKGKLTSFIDPGYNTKNDGTPAIESVQNVIYKNGKIIRYEY